MSFLREAGPHEPFSDTLRFFFHDDMDPLGITTIAASGNKGGDEYDATARPLTDNDWRALNNRNALYLYEGAPVREDVGSWRPGTIRKTTVVYLDLLVKDAALAAKAMAAIDDRIRAHMPNNRETVTKSSGMASGILTFDRQALDWKTVRSPQDRRTVLQYSAELGCVHQPA